MYYWLAISNDDSSRVLLRGFKSILVMEDYSDILGADVRLLILSW